MSGEKEVLGGNVVVLDGDAHFMGSAMAELMVSQGKHVTVVTHLGDVAPFTVWTGESSNVKRLMREKGITALTSHWATKFDADGLHVRYLYQEGVDLVEVEPGVWGRMSGDESTVIPCDTLILVTSRVPNDGLYRGLKDASDRWEDAGIKDVFSIGDAVHARAISDAIFDGQRLGREFDTEDPAHPLPFIRERQVWGHETFPKLGDERPKVEGPLLA